MSDSTNAQTATTTTQRSGTQRSGSPADGGGPLRALLVENIHADAKQQLTAAGFEVETHDGALDEDELIKRLAGIHLLGIRSTTHLTEKVFAEASDLIAVGAFCIGTNQIDLPAATERGIACFNAPFSNTRSVVELAIAEIIAMTRRLTDKSRDMHAGVWDKSAKGSHEVRGRTIGIVGYGNIGSQLSVISEALGMRVLFYDTTDKLALGNAQRCGSLEELLNNSDVVTLHVDGRPGNSGMFGEQEFSQMRSGSLFLNLSRGFVVDHASLRDHINSGHIAGAAIDVFPEEPKRRGEPFESELRDLPNVILTPHVGGSTEEAQQDIGRFVASKLVHYVRDGNTTLSVNLPPLALEEPVGGQRLVHVHHNIPGVLAKINSLLAAYNVNIEGQVLGTRGDLGYVISDIASPMEPTAVAALEKLEATVRVRLLS